METSGCQQLAHGCPLIVAMFDGEQSARAQTTARIGGDGADGVESIAAGCERRARFKAQIAAVKMRILSSDIGRIAQNRIQAGRCQRREPVHLYTANPLQPKRTTILTGDGQRSG